MTPQRIVFAIVLSLQAACVAAAQQNVLPTWTPFLALAGSVLLALMNSIAPPKDPPPPAGPSKLAAILFVIGAAALATSVEACALFTPENLPKTELVAKDITCIIEHAFVDDATLNKVCDLLTPARQAAAKEIAAAHREQIAKRMSAMRAEACSDAGAK